MIVPVASLPRETSIGMFRSWSLTDRNKPANARPGRSARMLSLSPSNEEAPGVAE